MTNRLFQKSMFFVLINGDTGLRSEVMHDTPQGFINLIFDKAVYQEMVDDNSFIFVLLEQDDDGNYSSSSAPLMRLETFVSLFPFSSDDQVTVEV